MLLSENIMKELGESMSVLFVNLIDLKKEIIKKRMG